MWKLAKREKLIGFCDCSLQNLTDCTVVNYFELKQVTSIDLQRNKAFRLFCTLLHQQAAIQIDIIEI